MVNNCLTTSVCASSLCSLGVVVGGAQYSTVQQYRGGEPAGWPGRAAAGCSQVKTLMNQALLLDICNCTVQSQPIIQFLAGLTVTGNEKIERT